MGHYTVPHSVKEVEEVGQYSVPRSVDTNNYKVDSSEHTHACVCTRARALHAHGDGGEIYRAPLGGYQ